MGLAELTEAFDLIELAGDGDFEGEKDEQLVLAAESALGHALPTTYRRFVRKLGCGDVLGLEVYGVIDSNFEESSVPSGISLTLNQRQASGLNSKWLLIAETGEGGYFALDCSGPGGEAPVVEWQPGTNGSVSVAPDFGVFLLRELKSRL